MDEPLSNLDAKLRVQMRGEIARLQKRLGTTTVYVTHDQTEAMTLGDRVVVMHGGVAQQIGTPDELYERPANLFVAGFIGSPAMNFFPATLTRRAEPGVRRGDACPSRSTICLPRIRRRRTSSWECGPEHLQDAELIDGYQRISSLIFEVNVDLVESLGSDKYVYFTTGVRTCTRPGWTSSPPSLRCTKTSSWQGFPLIPKPPSGERSSWLSTQRNSRSSMPTPVSTSPCAAARRVTLILDRVRAYLRGHFDVEPDSPA